MKKTLVNFGLFLTVAASLSACGEYRKTKSDASKSAVSFNTNVKRAPEWVSLDQFSGLNCSDFDISRKWKRDRAPSISIQKFDGDYLGTVKLEKTDPVTKLDVLEYAIQFDAAHCVYREKQLGQDETQTYVMTRVKISSLNQFTLVPCEDESCKRVNVNETMNFKEHLIVPKTTEHDEIDVDENPSCPDLKIAGEWKQVVPVKVTDNGSNELITKSILIQNRSKLSGSDEIMDLDQRILSKLDYEWSLSSKKCILSKNYLKKSVLENSQWLNRAIQVRSEYFMVVRKAVNANGQVEMGLLSCADQNCASLKHSNLTKMISQNP